LSPDEQVEEALFTGLRLVDGLDLESIRMRYGLDAWAKYGPCLAPFVTEGLIERAAGRLRLTRAGMLVANEIMAVFV
ncbi:MAG: radical SAM family heme chaperone HemW, partial [Geminicoccales bacterium]